MRQLMPYADPEKNLWAWVLKQASEDATLSAWHPSNRNLRDKAHRWIQSGKSDVGSFLWICHTLGLDADHIRDRITRDKTQALMKACA
jgi:hypothetical protein